MSKNFKVFLIIYSVICLITILIFCLYKFSLHPKLKQMCLNIGGEYRLIYNDCQTTNESLGRELFSLCSSVKGDFNSCESSCLHNPKHMPCMPHCILVCKF